MSIIKTKLFVGATTPFQVLHLSDTHLTRADLRDGQRKVTLAQNRLPHFSEAEQVLQQLADETTLEVIEYIKTQSLIKALITGHLHFNYEGTFAGRIPQIVTACTDARLIEIV